MDTMTFAEWLRVELDWRDWSKADLARAAGISAPHVTRIMNSEQSPGTETILAIARALSKPPEEVFRRAVGLPLNEESPGLLEWVEIFVSATPEQREEILDYARYKTQPKPWRRD